MAQEQECWGRAGARAEPRWVLAMPRWDLQQVRGAQLSRAGEQSRQILAGCAAPLNLTVTLWDLG